MSLIFCGRNRKKYQKQLAGEVNEALPIYWKPIEDIPVTNSASKAPKEPVEPSVQYSYETQSRISATKPLKAIVQEIKSVEHTIQVLNVSEDVPHTVETHPMVDLTPNGAGINMEAKRDSNDNVVHPMENTRPSNASVLSNGSEISQTIMDVQNAGRRKAFREDEDEDIELQVYPKSSKEEETIKKAMENNEFLMSVVPDLMIIKQLIPYMRPIEINNEDVIMRQGDEGDSMYVSRSGEFEVNIDGQVRTTFRNCRLFGELAILYNTVRTASIIAHSTGMLWQLERKVYRAVAKAHNINEQKAILEFLRKVPDISAAPDKKLEAIAELCNAQYFKKGTPIVREGEPGNEFYIIKIGTAIVSKVGKGKVKELTRGDFFGEKALLNEDKRMATVTSGDYGVSCLILSRTVFNEFLGDLTTFLDAGDEEEEEEMAPRINEEERKAKYADITLENLKFVRKLGEGGFGTVDLVKVSKDRSFALKSMEKELVAKMKRKANVFIERDIQRSCADSIFIVQLYRTFQDKLKYYYLIEYCPRGELFKVLRKKGFFSTSISKFISACIMEGLLYLHRRRIAYLDLKPENVLIDIEGYPKLADFGNAMNVPKGQKLYSFTGTIEYMAPEIFKRIGYDTGADYWAFGVLLYEMLMGRTPFVAKEEKMTIQNITKNRIRFISSFDKTAKELIKRLMDPNPSRRLGYTRVGAEQLRQHDWFKGIDLVQLRNKKIPSPLLKLFKK